MNSSERPTVRNTKPIPKVSEPSTCAVEAGMTAVSTPMLMTRASRPTVTCKPPSSPVAGKNPDRPGKSALAVLEAVLPDLARLAADQAPWPTFIISPPSMKYVEPVT